MTIFAKIVSKHQSIDHIVMFLLKLQTIICDHFFQYWFPYYNRLALWQNTYLYGSNVGQTIVNLQHAIRP